MGRITSLRVGLTMLVITLAGCGSGGGGGAVGDSGGATPTPVPEGYTAVSFTASAGGNADISHALADLGILKDATGTGSGDGGTVNGPTSINDTSAVTCAFDAGGLTSETEGQGYTVRMSTDGACANANECITCTTTTGAACVLTCTGVVPSSSLAAADTFDVSIEFTSTFSTNMPANNGTLRFDASATGTGFSVATALPSGPDLTECDGVTDMTATAILQSTWFAAGDSTTEYRHGYTLSDVTNTSCVVTHLFMGTATLTGVDTAGATVSQDLGTVTMNSKICDDKDASAVAHSSSVCGAGAI